MASLQAELDALKQQHEFTVMELTDLKEDYERIKKLNNTILQNMLKEPSDMLNEIKVIIDGNLYNQKIVDLEAEVELLRNRMSEEVQRRAQQIANNKKSGGEHEHDIQSCIKCRKLVEKCPKCSQMGEKYKVLEKRVIQKSETIDMLRLEIEQKRSEFEVPQSRKNNQKNERLSQLEQINRILKENIQEQDTVLKQEEMRRQKLDEDWQQQYANLQNQFNSALEELEQYRQYYQNQQYEQNLENEYQSRGKKQSMMQEIQNILGELGDKRSPTNMRVNGRMSKLNQKQSRIAGQENDFSSFSIKDAINRPGQFTFY